LALIAAGTVFQDRYEILSLLGEGGFGLVYRARHKATNQEVAIKMLKASHLGDELKVARFRRELHLCAQLYHPHIVRLFDSGLTEAGHIYAVFEFVPGHTLAEVLKQGALEPWEAIQLMLQVLDALGAAHKQGIIHRDLKPHNIMVTTTGVRRNALVLDFGLGTLSQEVSQEGVEALTRSWEMLGTPFYSAPEQLRAEQATARSDLYAWGLVFLECLTGKRVIEGATLQQVIYNQLGPAPVPFPPWLERHRLGQLLRRVTQKDPAARDVNAQGLLRELEYCERESLLTSDTPPGPGAAGEQRLLETLAMRVEAERRQVTALCCSLTLTGGEQQQDLEELDRLQRGLYAAVGDIARRFDAHVSGVLAERMLVYVGYPLAHEDDVRRAARMALELLAEMGRRGEELAKNHNAHLEVRAGIHTGLVITQEVQTSTEVGAPMLVGPVPGVASRLEALAEPGSILVSADSAKLLKDSFDLAPARAVRVGPATVQTFRLTGEPRASSHGKVTPLYGRTQELELLQQRWQQTVAGTGQALLLMGEPGIGKSRLAQELSRRAQGTPHTFLECRCAPEGRNSALRPVADLIERLLGFSREWMAEQTSTALEELLKQYGFNLSEAMPLFAALLPMAGPLLGYPPLSESPERIKELTLEAVAALFFEMAQRQPVLLMVEDLHWADPTTMQLISHMVGDVSAARLCLVLTARTEFLVPWPAAQVHQVLLSRLDRQRIEEMLKGIAQGVALPREAIEQVVSRTDGVPLFVEELARGLMEALSSQPDSSPTAQLAIPTSLRDSLTARLDRLGAAKETAQLAAALGREFSHELLKAVSTLDEAMLKKDLEALSAADLIHRRRGVRTTAYVFKHALIRDTAYESMLTPLRRRVHGRIAAALEQRFPELVQQRPDLLALHHAATGQKREAVGYAYKAALAALLRSAHHEALGHATEALHWLDSIQDEHESARLELELNSIITPALMSTRGWSDETVRAQVERSQALIDLLGDSPHVLPNLWALVNYHHLRAQHAQARLLAERLVSIQELKQDASHQAMALPLLAECLWVEGMFRESRDCATRALPLYDTPTPKAVYMYGIEPRVHTMITLSLTRWHLGFADGALKLMSSAMTFARELDHASTEAIACIFSLMLYHLRGERSQYEELSARLLELTTRQRLASQGAYASVLHCWAVRDVAGMQRGLDGLDAQGSALIWPYYDSMLAELEDSLGQRAAAIERLGEALRRARASGEGVSLMHVLYRLGTLLLDSEGEQGQGEDLLHEALGLARERGARMVELRAALPLSQRLLKRGQRTQAHELLAPIYGQFTEGFDLPDLVRARALLGYQ
jgi:TOMM system kinase/cyclase fusion protein